MNPTPPTTPSNGVATLMAEIERIAQELRAYNKRPLPATEEQVKALLKLAERDRPLAVTVNSDIVANQLLGRIDQQASVFRTTSNQLVSVLDERKQAIVTDLDQRIAALKAVEASLQATVQRIPKQVNVNWLGNWKAASMIAGIPLLVVLLMLWFTGMFSRVPKAELEQVQAELKVAKSNVRWFMNLRETLVKERPLLAYQYFPYPDDPKPTKKPATPKKKRK